MIKFFENFYKKRNLQKGVSLITLVITIVVIIILAALALVGSNGTIDEAAIATYRQELKDVEVSVSATRIKNQREGLGEEIKEKGFYPVVIENPPENFVSFGSGDFYGYVVDLDYIKNEETKNGYDYKKYTEPTAGKTITFGTHGKDNDVYIYDATGKVFYARGVYTEGGVYYSDILTQDGPLITVEKNHNQASNVVEMKITVTPVEEGAHIELRVNDSLALIPEVDGTYKYTATSNDVYIITAVENDVRTSVKRVKVDEIEEGEYRIVYHYQDEITPDLEVIKYGSLPIRVKNAKREGYKLLGWSKLASSTVVEYAPGDMFEENVDTNLYAIWEEGEPREFVITLNANGGRLPIDAETNETIASLEKIERETLQLPEEEPTKEGHTFLGWSKSSEAKEPEYLAGGDYTEEGDTTLFAVWQKGEIRVEIEISPEGAGYAVGGGVKEEGSIVYVTASANAGYAFYRWKVASANVRLDNNYAETTKFIMPKGTVRLIAEYKETEYDYTIKYNANNGSGVPNTQYKKHGEDINLSTMIPTRSAHTFEGWATKINAEEVEYLPGQKYSEDRSVTLYAVWKKNTDQCTLTFHANGGSNAPSSITKIKGTIIQIPTEEPVWNNLIFLGWSEDRRADEPTYRKSDYYTMSGDATLYAVWSDTEKPYVYITAEEKDKNLVLKGHAKDNGGIMSYAWTNEFYSDSEHGNITWTNLDTSRNELTIPKDVIRSGIHCFYAKDEDGNVSYASIEVFRMTFYHDERKNKVDDVKYKATGYAASLTELIPEEPMYVFAKWKATTDNKIYESGEKYLLNQDEDFYATWDEAYAYIPSTNKYYLTSQHAVNAVPPNTEDYVLVQVVRNETIEEVLIREGRKISYSTGELTLTANKTAMDVESGCSFKLVDGTIISNNYGIKNRGTIELEKGKITAPYGIDNSGTATMGLASEKFSRESIVVNSSKASYQVSSGGTLYFVNGKFVDNENDGTIYEVPMSGVTLRSGFEIRKMGATSATSRVTTLVEDLVMTSTVTAGTTARPVEIRVNLSYKTSDSVYGYTVQYSTNNKNWTNGSSITLIDNATVYGRILEGSEVANTEQLKISSIVELNLYLNGGGQVSNSQTTVKYKRPYGNAASALSDTSSHWFRGWQTSSGKTVDSSSTVEIAEDHTLYAQWQGKYPCKCGGCSNYLGTENSYCSTCASRSICSSSGRCTYHCNVSHECKCDDCSNSVSCNTTWCSTCDDENHCTVSSCYNCEYTSHYDICDTCDRCTDCGCTCNNNNNNNNNNDDDDDDNNNGGGR